MRSVGAALVKLIATATSGLVSFTTNVIRPVKVTCEFSPFQEGSGDPSPDNVRPISGWSECGVFQAQKNLFNKNAQPYRTGCYINEHAYVGGNLTSFITNNANYNIYALPVKPGQNYVFGIIYASQPHMVAIDHNQKILGSYGRDGKSYRNCLVPDSAEYLLFSVAIGGSFKNIDDFQVELGSDHSTYEAYHGAEIPITFTDPSTGDPLTVYGGTVTLNEDGSADLVKEFAKWVEDGSRQPSIVPWGTFQNVTWVLFGPLPAALSQKGSSAQYISNNRKFININKRQDELNCFACYSASNFSFAYSVPNTVTNKEEAAAYFQENPTEIVYPLATPQTYHFDNIGQLKTFLGTNNIWHNMNGDITVEYWNKQ